jgi:putative redox protein
MIRCKSGEAQYQSLFSNGKFDGFSDATEDKGGRGSGFRPHELLEAALASCMNIHLRMYADHHGIPLSEVMTQVSLHRSAGEVVFEYAIELDGSLPDDQRNKLMQIAETCPVRLTLSNDISFRCR